MDSENLNSHPDVSPMNNFVVLLMKKCNTFLSHADVQLGTKFYDLNVLCSIWKAKTNKDYSAEVYAAVAEMVAANVFRPLPPSSYGPADDEDAAAVVGCGTAGQPDGGDETAAAVATAEFAQTALVFDAFRCFLDRDQFDAGKMEPCLTRRFVSGLTHRLNSDGADERAAVRDVLTLLLDVCPSAGGRALDAAVAELADFAYGYVPRHNGVHELLDFLADTVIIGHVSPAAADKLAKVLLHLLKHQALLTFKSKLIYCVRTMHNVQKDLVQQMFVFITKLWSYPNLKTIALLSTMVELYNWCDVDQKIPSLSQIVGPLTKLFTSNDFHLSHEAMNFWNLILHENVQFWQNKQNDINAVVDALNKVKLNHWNADCIKMADLSLKTMALKCLVKDSFCVTDQEELFENRNSSGEINNNDNVSKHIHLPVIHSSTLSSFKDTPTETLPVVDLAAHELE